MATMRVAVLNQPGNVYVGLEDIDDADFDPQIHVNASIFGGACDLPPNRYYWDATLMQFRPIEIILDRPPPPTAPSMLDSMAVSLITDIWVRMQDNTPSPVTDWLDFYVMSVDFPANLRRTRPVVRYITERGLAPRGS